MQGENYKKHTSSCDSNLSLLASISLKMFGDGSSASPGPSSIPISSTSNFSVACAGIMSPENSKITFY